MLFLVLQQKNWVATRFCQLFSQQLPDFVKPDHLELTAIIDFKDSNEEINNNLDSYLNKAWMITQNGYLKSDGIQWRKKARSTDICDVIQLEDHRVFMVDSNSFKQLDQDPIIHVAQEVYPEYADPFDSFKTLNHCWARDKVIEKTRMNFYYLEFCEFLDSPGLFYQRLRSYK